MSKLRTCALVSVVLAVLLAVFVFAPGVSAVEASEPIDTVETENEIPSTPPEGGGEEEPDEGGEEIPEEGGQQNPPVNQGITEENGYIYFYNEDGTLFTDGYKEVTVDGAAKYYFFQEDGTAFTSGYKVITTDGIRAYYYFQEDGTAYTGGYLAFFVADKQYYFYFQEDGTAFTDGYKEVVIDGQLCYFYFLANGQGFNTGYKTAVIDGKKYYFYFGSDGRAVTDSLQTIPLGDRTAYMLFTENGKAYTGGYKEIVDQEVTDYYYFLPNGQAFTTGYKTVKIDDVTYYFFFEDNGKAYTDGLKEVPFGTLTYSYYFQSNGRAFTSGWTEADGVNIYVQTNGRVAKDSFVTIEEKLYYFAPDFSLTTGGWFCVGDGYYYADETGALATNTVLEGYSLNDAGKTATKYRVIQLVNEHTDPSMTDQEKIEAIYNWLLKNSMNYIRTYEHVKADWVWKDSWVDDMAASQLNNWGGNCFRYAALSGMMIREATGLKVTVYHGYVINSPTNRAPHGWITVEQDGVLYAYDVELDKHAGYSTERCYKVLYEESAKTIHSSGEGTNLY